MVLTDADLDRIEAEAEAAWEMADCVRIVEHDVPALIAEVRRASGLLRGVLMNINSDNLTVATMSSDTRIALDLVTRYLVALNGEAE